MEPLATIDRLAARVGEPITTPEELALADGVLREASTRVRHYGRPWPTAFNAPAAAVDIVVAAAARGYLNPAGFQMERGDSQTFNRLEDYAHGTELTPSEIEILKPYRVRGSVISVAMSNPDRPLDRTARVITERGYAPMEDGTKPFPLGWCP